MELLIELAGVTAGTVGLSLKKHVTICVSFRINQNSDCACKKVDLGTNCFSTTTPQMALALLGIQARDAPIIEAYFALKQANALRN
ncbi:MAG TPA: hypothetical protein VF800_03050 [Telluria sp.]|jgi:hypothetical protein